MKLSADKKESQQEVFSIKEKDKIIERIFILSSRNFSNIQGGRNNIDSSFLYKGNGGEYYEKVLNSGKYDAYQKEIDLIKKNKIELQKYIGNAVTDIGCGNGEKAIDLLDGCSNLGEKKYIASDYSASMIEIAENNVSQKLPDIKLGNHQIMRQGNELFTNALDNNTYLRFGCTMGNFSNDDIIQNIQKMNNRGIFKGNNIIFSYFDVPTNDEEIKKTIDLYDNDEGRDFIFNGLQNLGLDVSNFELVIKYDKDNNCIYEGVELKNDYNITLSYGRVIRLQKGERFYVHQSKRFDYEDVKKILKQSGSKVKKHISENGISIVVARQDPKYFAKAMRITVITAGLLAATLGGYEYAVYKQEQKRNDIETEVLKAQLKEKELGVGFHGQVDYKKNVKDKIELLESGVSNVYGDFVGIYGMGDMKEDMIKAVIKNELSKGNNLDRLYTDIDNPTRYSIRFIKEQLVPNNKVLLASSGISMIPYQELQNYKSVFQNQLSVDGDIKMIFSEGPTKGSIQSNTTKYTGDIKTITKGGSFSMWECPDVKPEYLGVYTVQNYGLKYGLLKITVPSADGKTVDLILASPTAAYDIYKANDFSLKLGKEIAEDFLKNRANK